ncbi:ATP-binding protein [Streptomyces sp. NPDC001544]|uniref:ATP-binding protein n=1 Tax=Streptomyces sp. NPDC001544 TaxID=3364584 RepID=UPI0036A2E430
MRFGILGGTQVWGDDGAEVSLGGPARRALLTLLLVRPGEVVPGDRLADGVAAVGAAAAHGGGGTQGVPSAHALQSQVSRLRSALGRAELIERAGTGYRVVVDADDVDAGRFERLAREGRAALREGDAERAVTLLRTALGLWRGQALADAADSEPARAAAVRLEELRLTVLEDRIEAELRLGEHRASVPELRELVDRHPLRERLAGLLMRALSADGGQAEALLVFERVRRHLADELGADPSAELTGLHGELLNSDPSPSLTGPPAPLTSFVGRSAEVAEVRELLRTTRLVTLTGPGGVGKTRLSAEVARAESDEVCFVELGALRDPAVLPQAVLGALGLRENGLHAAAGDRDPLDRLVAALSGRMLLLALDNCEHLVEESAVLAARLLTTCPRLRVLATSREPLGVIGEHLHPVRPLDDAAAAELFTDRARAVRRAFVPAPDTVRRICAALDDLPLAIELAAARLRTLSLDELAERLHDRLAVSARGSRTADERHRTLRSVVEWSWELLDEPERRAARRFSVFAAGASPESARRVCGTDEDTLESLADKSLLDRAGGRYRMLATIRAYAAERLDAAGETDAVRQAHAATLLDRLRAADPWLRRAEQLQWLEALTAEQPDLLAAVRWAVGVAGGGADGDRSAGGGVAGGGADGDRSAWGGVGRGRVDGGGGARAGAAWGGADGDRVDGGGGARAGAVRDGADGDRAAWGGAERDRVDGVGVALELLASASAYLWIRGASGTAAPQAGALLDIVGGTPPAGLGEEYAICVLLAASGPGGRAVWHRHRASAGKALTEVWSGDRPGRYPAGLLLWMMRNAGDGDAPGAFALVSAQRERSDPWVRAAARYVSAFGPLGEGKAADAEDAFRTAVEEFRALGDRWGAALALDALAALAAGRGDRERAVALTDEALGLAERLGALEDCADLLVNRGDHRVDADPAAARADYTRAADLARRAGSPAALAAAQRGLADLALLERDPATAEDLYTQALEQLDPHWVKGLGNRVRTLAGLGRIAETHGDRAAARARYREAAESATAAVPGTALPDALRLLGLPEALTEAVSRR